MPASGAALLVALAMVPGYLYLQLTRQLRLPLTKSSIGEVLEILGVGLGTTGLAAALLVICFPGTALGALQDLQHPVDELDVASITDVAVVALATLAVALGLSALAAKVSATLLRRRYSPSVMQATLGVEKPGHVSVVIVKLANGRVFDGILHAFTLGDSVDGRAIALKSPIRELQAEGPVEMKGTGYFIAFGPDIDHVTLTHHPASPSGTERAVVARPRLGGVGGRKLPGRPAAPGGATSAIDP